MFYLLEQVTRPPPTPRTEECRGHPSQRWRGEQGGSPVGCLQNPPTPTLVGSWKRNVEWGSPMGVLMPEEVRGRAPPKEWEEGWLLVRWGQTFADSPDA